MQNPSYWVLKFKSKRNKWKRVLNQPRLNSPIDFRLLAVLELTKVMVKVGLNYNFDRYDLIAVVIQHLGPLQ